MRNPVAGQEIVHMDGRRSIFQKFNPVSGKAEVLVNGQVEYWDKSKMKAAFPKLPPPVHQDPRPGPGFGPVNIPNLYRH